MHDIGKFWHGVAEPNEVKKESNEKADKNRETEVAKKHIASHNVRAEEILTILERDYFVKWEGKRYELIGRTRDGRFLALFLKKEKDKFKLITARDATKTEKELYKKKVKY